MPEEIVQSTEPTEVSAPSVDATPSTPVGQVQKTYTDSELQEHVRRATSTTQRDLARVQQEHQRAMMQLQQMQMGQQPPPEDIIFNRGRAAALQEYQMRTQVASLAAKVGLEVDPYSPEVDEMLGRNPIEGYTKLATKLTDAVEKYRRQLDKEYKEKAEKASVDAHTKWSESPSARVPHVSGASTDVDFANMDSAKFKETRAAMIAESKSRRR